MTLTRTERIISHQMEEKGVSPEELMEAVEDLKELKEEHGEALTIAEVFEDDAVLNTVDSLTE